MLPSMQIQEETFFFFIFSLQSEAVVLTHHIIASTIQPSPYISHVSQPCRPEITSLVDLEGRSEARDPDSGDILYTSFYLITKDDDAVYFGSVQKPMAELDIHSVNEALERVPDDTVFPPLSTETKYTIARDDDPTSNIYVKRPLLSEYELLGENGFLARLFLSEIEILEQLSQHPHPNIIQYHGIRMRRGFITGIVLEKLQCTLLEHMEKGLDVDREQFMDQLECAVHHLHTLELAHNDLNPENIMISSDLSPVIIDFGSCQPVGRRMMSGGTEGWVDTTTGLSRKGRDLFSLERIRSWLQNHRSES